MRDSSISAFGPFLRKPSPAVPFCQSYVALPLFGGGATRFHSSAGRRILASAYLLPPGVHTEGGSRHSAHYVNPAQTIILECDREPRRKRKRKRKRERERERPAPVEERLSPIRHSMDCHRGSATLVACCADPRGCEMDRSADDRGPDGAPLGGLDSRQAVSQTVPIRSAQPDFARFPACRDRRGRRTFLPASWIRLAGDGDRC